MRCNRGIPEEFLLPRHELGNRWYNLNNSFMEICARRIVSLRLSPQRAEGRGECIMKNIIVLITILFSLTSCFPMVETYYEPSAKHFKRIRSECKNTSGPPTGIIIPGPQGVLFEVVSRLKDNGVVICFSITIPKNVNVTFTDNVFIIKNVTTGEQISKTTSSMYLIDNYPINCASYWGPQIKDEINIFYSLQGGYIEKSKYVKFNQPYWNSFEIENFRPDQFMLFFPKVKINEAQFQVPNILFKLKKGVFLSFDC